jgi:hypothetical protein
VRRVDGVLFTALMCAERTRVASMACYDRGNAGSGFLRVVSVRGWPVTCARVGVVPEQSRKQLLRSEHVCAALTGCAGKNGGWASVL